MPSGHNKHVDKLQDAIFLAEIADVCKRHRKSLSHQDDQGAFLIEPYDEAIEKWRAEAYRSPTWGE